MRPHTPDQVADMKSFVDSQPSGAERKTFALNGLEVTYTTVDMGDKKPFDYAVAAFVAPREDGLPITDAEYEIAVSNDVPEELQGIWAWHELNDFAVLGHEADNRCLQSEQILAESMSSEPDLYRDYLAVRIPFYEGLAAFIVQDLAQKGDKSVYSPADLKGCYDAIEFLKTQQPQGNLAFQTDYSHAPKLQTTEPTLLDTAKAKVAEEGRIAREETLNAQEKARIEAALKRESDDKAKEFINLMQSNAVPTRTLFLQIRKVISTLKGGYNYEGGYDYTDFYRVETSHLGEGWILKENNFTERGGNKVERGLMLLSNGDAYEYDSRSTKPEDYYIKEYSGPILNGQLHAWTGPLVAPFVGSKASILVDAIIKYGVDRPVDKDRAKNKTPAKKK